MDTDGNDPGEALPGIAEPYSLVSSRRRSFRALLPWGTRDDAVNRWYLRRDSQSRILTG